MLREGDTGQKELKLLMNAHEKQLYTRKCILIHRLYFNRQLSITTKQYNKFTFSHVLLGTDKVGYIIFRYLNVV
jgi:hypothetical protein